MAHFLAKKNYHSRDSKIKFKDKGHEYTVFCDNNLEGDKSFTSTTTLIHQYVTPFNADLIIKNMMLSKNWNEHHKYWGMTPKQIKDLWKTNNLGVADAGTKLHFDIECTYNEIEIVNNSKEFQMFLQFKNDHYYLEPYRTEWLIFDEENKITGSIDMVFKDGDVLDIYDWKRSKSIDKVKNNNFLQSYSLNHLPDSNYWHYSLQLNIYKNILERKYGMKVRDLYLVQLHPDFNNYIKIKCPNLQKEVQDLLFARKLKNNQL